MGDARGTDAYFHTMGDMQLAISRRDYARAARLARENLPQVPGFVRCMKQSLGSSAVSSIPALEVGGTMLALMGDDEGLTEMQRIVASNRELEAWTDTVKAHEESRKLFAAILEAVRQNPGCHQADVKAFVGMTDGRRISNLITWLEKAGKITRDKHGNTCVIWPVEAAPASSPVRKRTVGSHRTDRNRPQLHEISAADMPYVPLPRSPLRWEEAQVRGAAAAVPAANDHFEVRGADGWRIEAIDKIPTGERPDTAFRRLHPLDSGLLMVDDLGKAGGMGQVPAAVIRYDRAGELIAKKPLLHDVYRINVNPMGRGLIAMSRDCVVHAYDDMLELTLETALWDAPEIRAIRKRFDIRNDELKNHIRCVALSRDGSRYLFTAVDEAWCVGVDGRARWGTRLPITDGWTRVPERSEKFGTSSDVQQALSLIGLSCPFTQEDVKNRYRQLAKEWHPDRNPHDPKATERMKELNLAVELITGIDQNALPAYAGAYYAREMSRSETEAGGRRLTLTASLVVSEIHAADWIYAASFAGWSDATFLAGYSGRVVMVTESGEPVRAYGIGSVPRRIVDTGDYLYILTDTRLYVLKDETLHAIIDTFDGGDLIVAQTGFGLLENRRFRWFCEDGTYSGSVVTRDPIRRVYAAPGGITIETRVRRAFVSGAPAWWEGSAHQDATSNILSDRG